jgi:hypothetical protein
VTLRRHFRGGELDRSLSLIELITFGHNMGMTTEQDSGKSKVSSRGRKEFADLWRNAGRRFQLGFFLMVLGILAFVPSGVALGMILNGQHPGTFGWVSLICYPIGVLMIVFGSLLQRREMGRYRVRTESFNPYLSKGRVP